MYEEDNRGRNTILAVLGVVFVLALVAIFFFKARTPESVKAPTTFHDYVSSDKSFAGKVPSDWQRVGSGGMGIMSGVTLTDASAKISIMSDLQGSLMGDIARSSNASASSLTDDLPAGMKVPAMPAPKPPVEQLHMQGKGQVAEGIDDYDEGPMHEFPSPLGDARVSEWTGSEKGPLGMGTVKVHGYRATILGGERRVSAVCRCNDSDWAALKPAFWTVITSLKSGGG